MIFSGICSIIMYFNFVNLNNNASKTCINILFMFLDLMTMFKEYNTRFRGSIGEASESNHASSSQPPPESQDQGTYRMELVVEDFGYERMDCVYKEMVAEKGEDTRDELEVYLKEAVETPKLLLGVEFDILAWWKVHKMKYHVLAEMARDLLAMQVSLVASESAFSTSGRILEPYRSCLTHYMIEVLMCTEQWMHADIKVSEQVTTNEQILADVELLDRLQKGLSISSLSFFILSYVMYLFMLSSFLMLCYYVAEFQAQTLDD